MSWKWNQFWKRTRSGLIFGLIGGSIFGLILGLIVGPFGSIEGLFFGLIVGLLGALPVGLIVGLIVGLVGGLAGGFTDTVKTGKVSPNQGIKLSRKNALAAFLVTWLTVGLTVWLIAEPIVWLNTKFEGLMVRLIDGMIAGLIVGLIVGLNRGGSAVIKHYALRLILWRKGYTPFNFIKFLDHCAKLIFLKKVGGGYIFIHRMLLEYFAELDTAKNSAIAMTQIDAARMLKRRDF
jgi:eukaryotic-like serine/threonine-protein kinase